MLLRSYCSERFSKMSLPSSLETDFKTSLITQDILCPLGRERKSLRVCQHMGTREKHWDKFLENPGPKGLLILQIVRPETKEIQV